ncbi:MAG: hypothetical protein OXG74_10205 [Acidobacteria bacterium]|nr:hypothetical protein [Acidobacteriota bacterium]
MPELDLKSDDGLRRACDEAEAQMQKKKHARRLEARVALLQEVQSTPPEERTSTEFLKKIWFDETLGEMGAGKADPMSEVIENEGFRTWFAETVTVDLPAREDRDSRVEALERMRKALLERAKEAIGWQPLFMVNRVLAALFPEDLIELAYELELFRVLRALGGHGSETNHVKANSWIRERLEEVTGPPEGTLEALARRQYLPTLLSARLNESEKDERGDSLEPGSSVKPDPFSEVWTRFKDSVDREGLVFESADVESLHLGLWADEQRHFAVLAGLSGTGKTQLAYHYGRALLGGMDDQAERSRLHTERVQPGWHDPAPLLGYSNPLADGAYQRTPFLDFLLRASDRPSEPHVCILDEMNLSHPEQYLAPLLSAMEQRGGRVELCSGSAADGDEAPGNGGVRGALGVPRNLIYPANLVLIGTVNMDETTMGISDKVLDRAFTLEFWDVEVADWPGWEDCKLTPRDRDRLKRLLSDLMAALRSARLHFGWRVIAEIVHFLEARGRENGGLSLDGAMDRVIYAKVLPKLRGDDSPRFRDALKQCLEVLEAEDLHRSARKVKELDEDREAIGSFRFWR